MWFLKTSETDVWLSSYDHLTAVGGQRGGSQYLLQRKGPCFYSTRKKLEMNDDEERADGQAGRVYGCQIYVPGGIQSGLTNDWEQ